MAGAKSLGIGAEERTTEKVSKSWLTLIFSILLGIAVAFHFHYKLPAPANHLGINPQTGLSDFSERNAVNIISHLSDTIGYRKHYPFFFNFLKKGWFLTYTMIGIVGTIEEQQTYEYIGDVIQKYKREAQGIAGAPKFEMWVQQGTSSHRFDIMDKSKFGRISSWSSFNAIFFFI